jgi:hypothetical protein
MPYHRKFKGLIVGMLAASTMTGCGLIAPDCDTLEMNITANQQQHQENIRQLLEEKGYLNGEASMNVWLDSNSWQGAKGKFKSMHERTSDIDREVASIRRQIPIDMDKDTQLAAECRRNESGVPDRLSPRVK